MNITTFIKELEKINIKPTNEQLESLRKYKEMLIEYNKKFNLTAITNEEEVYLKHFYDSLTISKVMDLTKDLKVLDIGTGAGFPGLVLKIFYPNLEITLLDSNNKKIMFLEEVIKKLNLKNITCIHGRAEELPNKYWEYFDIVTSRAVASIRILAELSIPYLKVNGYFIAMKGKITEELAEAENTINKLHSKAIKIESFLLPDNVSVRNIIKIEKLKETENKYPRKYDQIVKKEIK